MDAVYELITATGVCSDCDEARSKVRCETSDDVTSQCVDVTAWCNGSAECEHASDETLCDTGRIESRHEFKRL